ncbi:MAG: translation initiation factor IF-2 [Leptospiraceae bacterium]|nr:translation initiation factor IF-2 [Leptospiraceae bacterium]MCK6379757.1 translation initiation factor IF-2 [Leptospiraceae bacterium]
MEKNTDKSSIGKNLQGANNPSKKKLVIKKKPQSSPVSSSQNASKKKNLDDLVKEENKKQSLISPESKNTTVESRSPEYSKPTDIEKSDQESPKKESNIHSHSKLAYPVRREDKNPIISRPVKPTQGGFQKEHREPRQYGGSSPQGATGSGNYKFRSGGQSQGSGNYQRNTSGNRPNGGAGGGRPGGGYQQRQGSGGSHSFSNRGKGNFTPGGGGYKGKQGSGGDAGKSEFSGTDTKIEIVPEGQSNRKRTVSHQSEKSREKNDKGVKENAKFFQQMRKKQNLPPVSGTTVPKEISIMENIQVGELAKKMNLKPGDVIAKLMKLGMMVTINNIIDSDTATLLADEYDCKVKIVSLYEETVVPEDIDNPEDYITRPPVVTIMGHVDHGKTKLLDTIRKTSVIDTESGGITQHIGAYQVTIPRGTISFLDTPGHEAFTSMRARGASITDIVVLVVAADDGVKPQTIEAINHAKAANVPIIVAINKIDLPAANPEKVMQELANLELQPEEWGGSTITCKVSARENIGIDKLLEMILIQAEVMELKANPKRRGKGTVIEAKLDPGRGAVATVLIQNGTLRTGYPFVAGVYSGRVRAMYDDLGHIIEEAPPSYPVLVTGLEGVPEAGDPFDVLGDEKEARNISQHRQEYQRIGQAGNTVKVTLDNMNEIIQQGGLKELKIILKADVRGTAEAIKEALEKLTTADIKLNVIHAGTGAIIDTDVMLASASNAIIVGFHVRANPRTLSLAEKEKVQIKYYSIIYDIVNEIRAAMEGMLEPEKIETVIGNLEIRDNFKISKIGNIAGCMVKSGKINKSSSVRVIHDGVIVFDGKLKSLKRVKDDVNEVLTGFECGILFDGYNDFVVGDEIEVYEVTTIARKL